MLQYLIILLDDTSTSFCHYENRRTEHHLISIADLKKGIMLAMKESLNIQFVYPDYELPQEYKDIIDTIDHSDIVSSLCEDEALRNSADIIVFHEWTGIECHNFKENSVNVLRTTKDDLFDKYLFLKDVISKTSRLNIVITDVETFTDNDFETYKKVLSVLSEHIKNSMQREKVRS